MIFQIKTRRKTLMLLTTLLAFAVPAIAEMSPMVYAEMQNKSPENLEIMVLDVSEKVSPDSEALLANWDHKSQLEENIYFRVTVRAKVMKVTKSVSGLHPGDEIEILYSRVKYSANMVGPSSPPQLVADQSTAAFLQKIGTTDQYMTAARGWSFEPAINKYWGVDLTRIHFEFDSYKLSLEARAILLKNSHVLNADPYLEIIIEGHTDEHGSDEYNLDLGERRAMITIDYLEALGVSRERLMPISYGEFYPLNLDQSDDGWAKNRRVEFRIK